MSTMCAWMTRRRCRLRATPPPPPRRRSAAGTGWWSCSAGSARRSSWASPPAPPTCRGWRSAATRATRPPAAWTRAASTRAASAPSECSREECREASHAATRAASCAATCAASWRAPAGAGSTTRSHRAWSCRPGCGCPSCYWANRGTTLSPAGSEEERAVGLVEATADDIGLPWLMREPVHQKFNRYIVAI